MNEPGHLRVAVTGATGNVGSAVVRALRADQRVGEIVGIARRRPAEQPPKVRWETADVARDPIAPLLAGVDAVIHLAWLIQPARDEALLDAVNVGGTRRVADACAAAGVSTLVHASSVGAYSAGPKDARVDERWRTEGIQSSMYSRQKAATEALLDAFEAEHRDIRVVRLRPGLVFQRSAASEIRRLFAGPLLPNRLIDLVPVIPDLPGLVVQAVHADDLADAYRRAVLTPTARGAFNVAADPPIDMAVLRRVLGARSVPVRPAALRAVVSATWRMRLQPTPPGWLDLALGAPLMDCDRAVAELGWAPRVGADGALTELLEGMKHSAGGPTPPLHPAAGGRFRLGELRSGVGSRV